MDPGSMLVTVLFHAAALVYKKAEDEAARGVWDRVKATWATFMGGEPTPAAITPVVAARLVADDPQLLAAASGLEVASPALRRLRRNADLVKGARILWVDDNPHWIEWERGCLEAAGAIVRTAERSESALAQIGQGFDLVISDIAREGSQTEGLALLPWLRRQSPDTPVIYYVGFLALSGTPAGAFGITNQPDELLHLCLDVLERRRA